MKNILVFVLIFGASFAFADQPTKLVCVSWMGLKTDIQESPIDDADVYPLDHLSTSLMIRETKVTLDCDIRSSNQPVRF